MNMITKIALSVGVLLLAGAWGAGSQVALLTPRHEASRGAGLARQLGDDGYRTEAVPCYCTEAAACL
jgi:hypothetical protein